MIRSRSFALFVAVLTTAAGAWAEAAEIASQTLQITGISLEVESVAVTTGADMPATIQTKFGGRKNEEAPVVEGLLAVGDLTGPGLETPIQLTTAPGHRFQVPGFSQLGVYHLQNIRLMKGSDFIISASPSVATITVTDLLQTEVSVRQLTPDELRARGIVVDGRNFDVYEYSFSFLIDGQTVEIPFPVIIDPRTHEVTPIRKETPFTLPDAGTLAPPRWTPPDIVPFELPPEPEPPGGDDGTDPRARELVTARPPIPAAIVIPNSLAVLHQFFGVILTVSNGAPGTSSARLEDITAAIRIPSALRNVKSDPAVAFGQPVPIVDAANGVTFLIAQAKGEAEWTLEGLAPGTHTIDIDVRATYVEEGQRPVRLHGTPRASIVVHDARFNINFSHPDTVRDGLEYSTYTFVTNTSPAQQTIRIANGLPSCDQNSGANVCRISGAETDEITLAAGEMRMIEYKLRSALTGRVFASAGTIGSDNLSAAVQLHMGVSETGIPLSPATLILPHYAQFLSPSFISSQLQLLGLGYSVATAPVTSTTARFPRVIRTDVFYRAVDIARAGQKVFIADGAAGASFDAFADLSLDLLGNGVELREWDQLRREVPSGRVAGAALFHELHAKGMAGRSSIAEFADAFAASTSHRAPYMMAITDAPASLAIRTAAGGFADVPNEAPSEWKRTLPFADVSEFGSGQIAIAGRVSGTLELLVTAAATGALGIDIILPQHEGGLLRARLAVSATEGETLRIAISPGATSLQAILPDGGTAAVATTSPVNAPARRAVAARQDLHLDPEGHKVSVLFDRPLPAEADIDLLPLVQASVALDRDGVVVNASRPIFAAAVQDGGEVVNLSFDHVLTTNAAYTIALDPQLSAETTVVPRIDNDRPAGILYGKFVKGDNTPMPDAEVRLFTGHFRGCEVGLFEEGPPPDCNPYRESPQYARTDAAGAFLFEYVPRDPIGDPELTGSYRLLGVNGDGKYTIIDGSVRLPGAVHFVNLQLLGRGAAEGTVRYDNGEKVAGAEVFVGSSMFNVGRRTTTATDGRFRIDDLPVGPITFSATDREGNSAFASGEIAAPGQVAQRDIVIFRQPFPGTGTIFGSVVRSDDGAPVPGARVAVFAQGYAVAETFTDARGRYEFRRVPAGFVTVLAADWSIATNSATFDLDLGRDESREIPPLILPIRAASSEVATIDGIVVREDPLHPGDSSFYQRVAGAIIKLGDRPPLTTDAEGRFTFGDVPLAWGNVVGVQAYDSSTKRVGKTTLPVLTVAGPNTVSIFIPAASFGEGLVRVRVIDAHGHSVSGFRVVRPHHGPLLDVGNGIHEYRNAPVGSDIPLYAVNGPTAYGGQFAQGSARLSFPGQVATVTLRLPGDGTVRVKLRSDIDLIGDVAIRYSVWDDAEQALAPKIISGSTVENGAAGWATFPDVPALQSYSIESLHPVYGYAAASGQLAYDGDFLDHVLQLNRLSTIQGTVYAIDGVTPIAGASVRIEDGRRDPGSQLTAADGTFAFHDVPAGAPFRIIAEATQSGIYRTGVAYGTTPDNGGPVSGIAVLLLRRGSVEGRVVYNDYKVFDPENPAKNVADDTPATLSDNAPVPLAALWLRELAFPGRDFGTDAAPLTTDVAGRFAIPNVFIGPLRARAWDTANQELQGTWTGEIGEEGETLTNVFIGVGDGGTGSIRITVVDPNQQLLPVSNAEVSLFTGALFDLTSTDGTGVARFEQVPAGTYSATGYSKALGKLGASGSFNVARDQTTEIRILLEFSGEVTGSLTDLESMPADAPVPGAAVTLSGLNYQTRTSTDSGGAFVFEGVREGSFALDAKDTQSNRRARATRSLSAADPQPHVDLQLEPTETLHAAVYLPDDAGASSGVLAPAVEVTATQRGGEYLRTVQGNPVQLPKMFRNEPYEVVVRELGGEQRTFRMRHVSFPNGSAASPLTFVYGAVGSVEARVTQGGAPADGARVIIGGGGRNITLFTGADGRAVAHSMPLGGISAQVTSLDGAFSGTASGTLLRASVPLIFDIDLGAYAGVTGLVEAETGGPSIGTRVLATFDGRTLEMATDGDGRYTFHGIRVESGTTTAVTVVYVGPDDITIGAQRTVAVSGAHASQIVTLPGVRLDATPPQLVDVQPADGATNVPPDTFLRFTFSEAIRAADIHNGRFQLVAADGSGQLFCSFDEPALQPDGRVVITMRPPPASPFPLKSNTLYRIIVSGEISDLTGHKLPAPRGQTFTTSDYAEPRVVKVVPAPGTPAARSQTFEFHFSEPVEGPTAFRFFKLAAPGGSAVAELQGSAFLDHANPARLLFGPADPIEPESYYRAVFSGVSDLQGNALAEQAFEFSSFDETAPFVTFVPPVPDGMPLVSGVEYTLGVDLRNGAEGGSTATDVASVEWLRVDGTTEAFLTTLTAAPFSYRFVAPEAPPEGTTYTLRAIAVDRSANRSEPATITFAVKPNAAPENVALTLTPASAYPGNVVAAGIRFDDEGITATVQVTLRAAKNGGGEHLESKTTQVNRPSVTEPWPAANLTFALPVDLSTAAAATFTATVTDVRGIAATATRDLALTPDTGAPLIMSVAPAAESRFEFGQQYEVEVVTSDAETAVAEVVFVIAGQTYRVTSSTDAGGGARRFRSPVITVPAKHVDTRVVISATAIDYHLNSAQRELEIIYTGVFDPEVPTGAWICPVDRAALPASQTALTIPLRVRAADDVDVASVQFLVPGLPDPIVATEIGDSGVFTATATFATPAAGEPFVITAEVRDDVPEHTIELPIHIDLVDVDVVVDATQAVTASTLAQYENRSVAVRGATGRLVTHVPVTLRNLLVLDGGRVESLATTTSLDQRVDVTVTGHLYVDCNSMIDVRAKGYLGGWGANADGSNSRNESPLGRTVGNATTGGANDAGGSHAGLGQIAGGTPSNDPYGSIVAPAALGSGGGGAESCCTAGGSGGGAIALRGGRFAIAGRIAADGGSGHRGGSGGSVFIDAQQIILGAAAVVSANGGDAPAAGGGGRVAVLAAERYDLDRPFEQLQSRGGKHSGTNGNLAAAAGTVFIRRPGQSHGELLIGSDPASPLTRSTPIGGDVVLDRVELGPLVLARVDGSLATAETVVHESSVLLSPSDFPSATIGTVPPAGSSLIRATDLEVSISATSPAGIAEVLSTLSVAPAKRETVSGYPVSVADRATKIPVAFDAPLGAATFDVRITDRADRFVDLPQLSFTIVDNAAPRIDAFTAIPDALYPGSSLTATVDASDDVRVTNLSITSVIGAGAPDVQSAAPNAPSATRSFTVAVPITTPGGTPMTIEAAVEDNFPSRPPVKQAKSITILTDANPPTVTISEPTAGTSFNEAAGATFTVRSIANDGEVGIAAIAAQAGNGMPVAMTLSGGTWTANVPVPNVDGTDPVPVTVTVTASDYEGNTTTETIEIVVVPLNDPNAPAVRWACGGTGALYPAADATKLRVYAKGATAANGVQKVEFFVGFDATPIAATAVSGLADHYEATWTVPDQPDGTTVDIRVVATSVAGNQSDLSSTVTIVKSAIAPITANLTIDASNAATYAGQTLIIRSGTVTVVSEQTFARLVMLGGILTHPTGGEHSVRLALTDAAYIGCGAAIDVTGLGYAGSETYPGATPSAGDSAGSHLGRGGSEGGAISGSTFGSVTRPREAGGGASGTDPNSRGGGVVRITAPSVAVDGAVKANGRDTVWAGAGGSVWISATQFGGGGSIEARGGGGGFNRRGGGGAIAIEYQQTRALPILRARGGDTGNGTSTLHGAAGTIFIRGPASTFGDLILDNAAMRGNVTQLPSLGSGTAQSGTAAGTLVTDRAADIPPYFDGHWVEIRRGDTLLGTWQIESLSGRTATLTGATDLQPGDSWQGVYRFDTMVAVQGETYSSADPIRLGVNGVVSLQGPTTSGQYLELFHPIDADQVTINGNVALPAITARTITVAPQAVLTPPSAAPAALKLTTSELLTISAGAIIDANARGYAAANSYPGATPSSGDSGGSHIGRGGAEGGTVSGSTFGSITRPAEAGGGGSGTDPTSIGGGVIRIEADAVRLDGIVRANGRDVAWAGAGGSVSISARDLSGTGAIEARGGGEGPNRRGGGGAIAITYEETSGLPARRATGGRSGSGVSKLHGGAGSVYVRGPSSTFGDLTFDNAGMQGTRSELPALGRGTAQSGTGGATLVTDHASDIPPYFEDHWIEIRRGGAHFGTWRVDAIAGRSVVLAGASDLQPGDEWLGLYRFDSLILRSTQLVTADRLQITATPDLDAASSILGNNDGAPALAPSRITLEELPTGTYVIGQPDAVTDGDPVIVTARNTSGGTFQTTVSGDGSFVVQVFGAAGEEITITARDGNFFPMESPSLLVGILPSAAAGTTQIARSSWTSDTNFRAQTLALEGTLLVVAPAAFPGSPLSGSVAILDVTDPTSPAHVRTIAAGSPVRDIAVENGWLFLAADRLLSVDLGLSTPELRAAAIDPTGSEEAIALSGGYAFTSAGSGTIHIYDVSEPASPRYIRSESVAPAEGTFTDLIPYGTDYLIGLNDGTGASDVVIIDRRNVNDLAISGTLTIASFNARRGSIDDGLLYAVSPGSSEVVVVDLASPANPVIANRLVLPAAGAGHVRIAGGYGFIANGPAGLTATSLPPLTTAGNAPTGGMARDMAIASNLAYVATDDGLSIVPLSIGPVIDAARITLSRSAGEVSVIGAARAVTGRGVLAGNVRNTASGHVEPLSIHADGAFEATLPASGGEALELSITDAENRTTTRPLNAAPFASIETNVSAYIATDESFFARRIGVDGTTALITGGTLLADVVNSSPSALLVRPSVESAAAAASEVNDSVASNGFGFVAGTAFTTLNYTNATPVMSSASADPAGRELAVAISGTDAFTSGEGGYGTLHIYDVSSPTAPQYVRSHDVVPEISSTFSDLILLGTEKLIGVSTAAAHDIVIIDVQDRSSIVRTAVLDIPSFTAHRGALAGDRVYLTGGTAGVALVDVSDPAAPVHAVTIDTPGVASGVAVLNAHTLVVADGSRGLTFINIADPAQPVVLGSQGLQGNAVDVAVADGAIHVVTETRYLVVRP